MGCGASKTSTQVDMGIAPAAQGSTHTAAKQATATRMKRNPTLDRTASLGKTAVHSSFLVTAKKKIRESDTGQGSDTVTVSSAATSSNSLQVSADALVVPATSPATRPALQVLRLTAAPLSCLAVQPAPRAAAPELSLESAPHIQALVEAAATAGGAALRGPAVLAAAAHIRVLSCSTSSPPSAAALQQAGVLEPLLSVIAPINKAGGAAADGSSSRSSVCVLQPSEEQAEALWTVLNVAGQGLTDAQSCVAAGAATAVGCLLSALAAQPGLELTARLSIVELALWAAGNLAGARSSPSGPQELANDVLEAGVARPAIGIVKSLVEQAAAASASTAGTAAAPPPAAPLLSALRAGVWCVSVLTRHKRERELLDAIPVLAAAIMQVEDVEILTCAAWALAHLASNSNNAEFMKQALCTLPKLAMWVQGADSGLGPPSLACLGALCAGHGVQDYSTAVVDAGGVAAMLSYLKRASALAGSSPGSTSITSGTHTGGFVNGYINVTAGGSSSMMTDAAAGRQMRKEALFALSNVAGGNSATARALLDAGAFQDVQAVLKDALIAKDGELQEECLYVLINPLAHSVSTDHNTTKGLLKAGIVGTLCGLLQQADVLAPSCLLLTLTGIQDALKKGQQLLKWSAEMAVVDGTEPLTANPVGCLYRDNGTLDTLQALQANTADEDVRNKANGLVTLLAFL